MAVEKMSCCGALTAVYRDAGSRQHNPGCRYAPIPTLSDGMPRDIEEHELHDVEVDRLRAMCAHVKVYVEAPEPDNGFLGYALCEDCGQSWG